MRAREKSTVPIHLVSTKQLRPQGRFCRDIFRRRIVSLKPGHPLLQSGAAGFDFRFQFTDFLNGSK